jgi:hypothetical protein
MAQQCFRHIALAHRGCTRVDAHWDSAQVPGADSTGGGGGGIAGGVDGFGDDDGLREPHRKCEHFVPSGPMNGHWGV